MGRNSEPGGSAPPLVKTTSASWFPNPTTKSRIVSPTIAVTSAIAPAEASVEASLIPITLMIVQKARIAEAPQDLLVRGQHVVEHRGDDRRDREAHRRYDRHLRGRVQPAHEVAVARADQAAGPLIEGTGERHRRAELGEHQRDEEQDPETDRPGPDEGGAPGEEPERKAA